MAPIGGVRAGYLSAAKDAIPDSAISQWTFDNADISSGVLSDVWGSNDITFSGEVTSGQSGLATNYDSGESVGFDGSDDLGDSSLTPQVSSRSLIGWVDADGVSNFQHIAGTNDYSTNSEAASVYFNSNEIVYEVKDGSNTAQITTSVSANTPHHVCLTVDSDNNVTAYLDASSVGSDTSSLSTGTITSSLVFRFGSKSDGNERNLDGNLDAWYLYSKELTSTEVSNHYNTGSIVG